MPFEVAKTTTFTLPVMALDDKLNLQLALARAALMEERRKRLVVWFETIPTFFRLEPYIAVAELDICSETVDRWHAERVRKGKWLNSSSNYIADYPGKVHLWYRA